MIIWCNISGFPLLERTSTTCFLVSLFLEFLLRCISLVLDLLISLLDFLGVRDSLVCLVLRVLLVQMRKTLHHAVNLLLLLVHEGLLEWTFRGQVQSLEQIGLTTLIDLRHIVENGNFLLLLEG